MENPVLSLAEEPLEFHADPIPVPMPVFTLPPCKPFWNLQTAMIGGAFLCLLAGTGIVYFTGSRSTAPDKTGNPVAGMTPASTRSENHALPIAPPDPSPDTKSSARRADGNSTEKKSAAAVNTVTVTPGAAVRKDAKLAVGGSAIPAGNSSQPAGTPAPVSAVEKPVPTAPPTPQTQNTVEPESIPATKTAAIADAPAPTAKPANPPTTPPPTVSKKAMPAVVIFRVLPDYPELARRSHTTGTVVVDILIDEKGKVVKANAVSGPAMLYLNAANAVLLWQFKPATLDGIAVSSSSQVSIVFK
jgi:protein TonB